MTSRFSSPIYNVTLADGQKAAIDVTNSISAGLDGNAGLIKHVGAWMNEHHCTRILDFGAGALRHTLPLLKKGFEVISVEYENAYQRPKAQEAREKARKMEGFTEVVWPNDFLKSKVRYDVALLVYVLQVIPVKKDRDVILEEIAKRFDRNGPKRLYYASRTNETEDLSPTAKFNDGWVKGVGVRDRTFYTEWKGPETDAFFKKQGYVRVGRYDGATQGYIYDHAPGVL